MDRHIFGMVMVNAPHSVLNCASKETVRFTSNNDNETYIKRFYSDNGTYNYVSAQAWRYWWRNVLVERMGWLASPPEQKTVKGKTYSVTSANPVIFKDDDVFGYMRLEKGKDNNGKVKDKSRARKSPLQNTPLCSVNKAKIAQDWGVANRHEGNPVPFVRQFVSSLLHGAFTINVDSIGRYTDIDSPGVKNLDSSIYDMEIEKEYAEILGLENVDKIKDLLDISDDNKVATLKERKERVQRINDTLKVLPYLSGGAMSTSFLTDVSPKFIMLVLAGMGNNIFIDPIDHDTGVMNWDFLAEQINDYQQDFLTPICIGMSSQLKGQKVMKGFDNFVEITGIDRENITTPSKAVDRFTTQIETTF